MTSDLTPRQKSVMDFIVAFQQEHLMAPTVREICAHLGLRGPAGIHRILGVLKGKGFLISEPGKKRSWRFSKANTGQGIPLVGSIAAGVPIEAIENFQEELAISPKLFGCDHCFGLRVSGDSMVEAHILDDRLTGGGFNVWSEEIEGLPLDLQEDGTISGGAFSGNSVTVSKSFYIK